MIKNFKIKMLFIFFTSSYFFYLIINKYETFQIQKTRLNTKTTTSDIDHKMHISTTPIQFFAKNKEFIINNNLAQYSSYLIIDQNEVTNEKIYRVESLVHFKTINSEKYKEMKNFICILRSINGEILSELEPSESPKFYWNENRKLIYNLDLKFLKDSKLTLNTIVIAIIWKPDFNKSLELISVSDEHSLTVILPYKFIKYQIPEIINTQIPRLPSVCFCIHYTYAIPSSLLNYIDYNLALGVQEIVFYDAIKNKGLTRYLKNIYADDSRITIMPFEIDFDDICDEKVLFKQYPNIPETEKQILTKSCEKFFEKEFQDKLNFRGQHEQLTVNDCFTLMSQKHEFIGYFDLDEIVYPRNMNLTTDFFQKTDNFCGKRSEICNSTPFKRKKGNFYDYLHYLIKINGNGRDIKRLSSINFLHATSVIPNSNQKNLMTNLGDVLDLISNSSKPKKSLFPLMISLSENPINIDKIHYFVIKEEDVNHAKYLYKTYESFTKCFYESHLKNIDKIDKDFIRYLYFLTEPNERMGKAIHYYKNVKSLFVHYASDTVEKSWHFSPSYADGNFMQHYRFAPKQRYGNITGSILKLNIDLEYGFFLLKNFTNFCN